ncbi:hypothetical protein AX17_006344 [Amanita inopinata Kibby_2008]|nr:hypothetical protein AX17_006344 [Amanita inopinata Kibby_2008]
MEVEGLETELLEIVKRRNREGRMEDAVAKAWKELTKGHASTVRSADWKQQGGLLYFRDHIYIPQDMELRRCIVELHHNTPIVGHPGRWKTLELVGRNYWWPQMSQYIGNYCRTCNMCLCMKIQRHALIGELHPLPIPSGCWEEISVDFIVELPESMGHNAIMVIINRLTKRAHFIATNTTITALGTARLFLTEVWRHHGLPRRVVSDWGTQFVANFTHELWRLLSIEGAHSTAYHPQTDGQTERVNQELEQFLRVFINEQQDNWYELLPLAEFAYNNHIHAAMQTTPFYLDMGRHPCMGFEPLQPSHVEATNELVQRMQGTIEEAQAALVKARDEMKRYYDRHRQPAPKYQVGNKVYVSAEDFRTTRLIQKLSHRYLGLWPILAKVGEHAYRLKLPAQYSRIHPVFGVTKLMPAPQDPIEGWHQQEHPPPELINGKEEYEVERIWL